MNFSLTSGLQYPVKLIAVLLFCLSACTTDKILETPDSPSRLVRVLFSPNGLGDLSFNDDILRGILHEKEHNNFRLEYLSPVDMVEAEAVLCRWQEEDTDPELYYTIIAGSEFEKITRRTLPQKQRHNYVMFDTPARDFTISTFRFCGYGVSFLAGITAYSLAKADTAAYIGGQQGEYFIEECYKGFRAGYLHAGGKEVAATYISPTSYGFAMPQRAYQMADSLFRLYPFIYVMAGSSNNGVYQYLREHPQVNGYTAGVDVDQAAYSDRIIGSMIKGIGTCVGSYIHRWTEREENPQYAEYDLRSGYTYFQVSESYKEELEEIVEKSFELAVIKEMEYERNKMGAILPTAMDLHLLHP